MCHPVKTAHVCTGGRRCGPVDADPQDPGRARGGGAQHLPGPSAHRPDDRPPADGRQGRPPQEVHSLKREHIQGDTSER